MMMRLFSLLLVLIAPQLALAANDTRMQVNILADDEKGISVEYLQIGRAHV